MAAAVQRIAIEAGRHRASRSGRLAALHELAAAT